MQVVLRLPTTPTVQGGWTTCARVRRLSMPTACLSARPWPLQAMALAMEWPSAVDVLSKETLVVGHRAFFAFVRVCFVRLLYGIGLQPANRYCNEWTATAPVTRSEAV